MSQRKFAIVTGASTGIGLGLARLAAQDGYDLLVPPIRRWWMPRASFRAWASKCAT